MALFFGAGAIGQTIEFFASSFNSWFGDHFVWFKVIMQIIGASFILFFAYLFFVGIHAALLGIFIDDILDAIQSKHFSESKWLPPPKATTSAFFSAKLVAYSFCINLLFLPFFLVSWFIPPLGILLQVSLNGYLLGKEYGYLIECRIPSIPNKKKSYLLHGILASLMWLVPILNFLSPVLLAGAILHSRMKHTC